MTLNPKASIAQRLKGLSQFVGELRADKAPIVLGPYRGELGLETSYWLPFLGWLSKQVKGFDQRAIVLTRGGLAPLYSHVAAHGLDIYAIREPKDVRRANLADHLKTGVMKQLAMTDWDEEAIEAAAKALGVSRPYHIVHPSLLSWLLEAYWKGDTGFSQISQFLDWSKLNVEALRKTVTLNNLPTPFVAVKFYGRHTFPHPNPDTAEFVKETVATLATHLPVVSLCVGSDYDDHSDIVVTGPNVLQLGEVPPEKNLAVQIAALSYAEAFVGTYGGVAETALMLGIASASFFTHWSGVNHAHFTRSSILAKTQGVPFSVGSLIDVALWRDLVKPGQAPMVPAVPMMPQEAVA